MRSYESTLFHDGGCYHIETSPLIYRANQWTGFYMIAVSVMKELTTQHIHITTHPMCWSCVSSYVLFMSIILWQYDFDCYNSLCFWLLFRNSDVLVLPSRRTLRDCRNVIKLTVGFYPKVIAELFSVTKDFCGKNMFV